MQRKGVLILRSSHWNSKRESGGRGRGRQSEAAVQDGCVIDSAAAAFRLIPLRLEELLPKNFIRPFFIIIIRRRREKSNLEEQRGSPLAASSIALLMIISIQHIFSISPSSTHDDVTGSRLLWRIPIRRRDISPLPIVKVDELSRYSGGDGSNRSR